MINSNVQSFQNGVDSIYNKCVSCGSTPSAKTPAAISSAIQNIYTNRYNAGYNAAGGDVKHLFKIQVFGDSDGWYYRTWIDNVYKGESGWKSGDIIYSITL